MRDYRPRKPTTPRSFVRGILQQIFLRSRERAAAIKREHGCCQQCGAKGRPKATRNGPACKIHVHHQRGSRREEIIDLIFEHLLCHPDKLTVLCQSCHEQVEEG